MSDPSAAAVGEEAVVQLTVDGSAVAARPGELIIEAAERAGVYIPRFCYHPHMEQVGMCRMCLVEVSGPRGFSLQPACFTRVAEGQEILTRSEPARKAQEGVLEFLLLNHPLDCPVCDKGGECPLQDQALSHGPGESRFLEEKRHWAKPIEIGPLVYLDRERCIQCARCTRFAEEIAGEAQIDFFGRGDHIEVAPFPTAPFGSYFSGNTVQICPVGALTSPAYRFKARPWDLEQVETTCTTCSVGCRMAAQSSAGSLVRNLGVDCVPVNQSWLCDKGRYGFEAVASPARLTEPRVRRGGDLEPASWHEAIGELAAGTRQARSRGDGAAIGVLGGARLSNEDAYAWSKLARGVLGTDSLDAQLGDGLPAELVLGLPRATIEEACSARVVLLLAGDLREELPVLYIRLRAAAKSGVALVDCSPVPTSLAPLARVRLRCRPGEAAQLVAALVSAAVVPAAAAGAGVAEIAAARALLAGGAGEDPAGQRAPGTGAGRGDGVVVVLGRQSTGESAAAAAVSAGLLHDALPGARFLPALRRGNVLGALDMGLSPGVLPGRVALEQGRAWYAHAWGAELPGARGRDAEGMLRAAAAGELAMLVLLGADPLEDFPDRRLAQEALESVPFLVSIGTHADASSDLADVVLPVAGDAERPGTTTNLEGRVSRLAQKVVPPGQAWPAWVVASELARRLGADLGFDSVDGITDEIARLAPAYRGLDSVLLASQAARDGVVAPLPPTPVALRGLAVPGSIDPMATPGITSVEEQGAPMRAGAAEAPAGERLGEAARSGVASREPSVARPAVLGAPARGQPSSPERLDAYSHRLVVRRRLYDRGTLVATCPSLAPLAAPTELAVHPAELASLGLRSGDRARVRSARGEAVVPVVADEALDRGVVVMTSGVGEAVSELLDASAAVNDVRLETPS